MVMPIPLNCRLPEGWRAVAPEELGSEAAFVAVHPGTSERFTAYLTADGRLRDDDADLRDIADEAFEPILRDAESATISAEIDTGSSRAPGLTRMADVRVDVDGQPLDLVRCEVFVTAPDTIDPQRRVILRFALTATPEQIRVLAADFEAFVDSMEPVTD